MEIINAGILGLKKVSVLINFRSSCCLHVYKEYVTQPLDIIESKAFACIASYLKQRHREGFVFLIITIIFCQ